MDSEVEFRIFNMEPIQADKALYIKLGDKGLWERDCIKRDQTLRLDYREIPHELCLKGDWKRVWTIWKELGREDRVATSHTNQIKYFYESGPEVLWMTFFGNHLWWCFSEQRIEKQIDDTKIRHVLGKWRNTDIKDKPLSFDLLSGRLLSMQGFRGTICSVKEFPYLLKKINCGEPLDVQAARNTKAALEQYLEKIIQRLHWKDFELLIDLIFRQAGWKRESVLGKSLKNIDMELISPITTERFGVQVKAKADFATFQTYREDRFKDMKGFTRFYFAVHTPKSDLEKAALTLDADEVKLLLPADIAHLSVEYGMASWIIDKAQ